MENISKNKKIKVAVGLSGGVDSSVSAALLVQKGYAVTGVFLNCWKDSSGCSAEKDRVDALRVATKLKIPFLVLNFEKEYKESVLDYFFSEYKKGRTPNPDILCNKEIKFGLFLKKAKEIGFDYVATGHYAKVEKTKKGYSLLKGIDSTKDQSYFLYLLNQEQLKSVLFPVGDLTKKKVRKLAAKFKLPTAKKEESQGICFVGEVNTRKFLMEHIKIKKGDVINQEGKIIGTHEGLPFYTIGQRHGFTIDIYQGTPLYVISKNFKNNNLIVGNRRDAFKKEFLVENLHWVGNEEKNRFSCDVRIRHLGQIHPADIEIKNNQAAIRLKKPAFGIAEGQAAVFYKADHLIGGGTIIT